ncbi:hypothetical protein CHLNCDRAFT_19318, partial [Chlorella variabilis]
QKEVRDIERDKASGVTIEPQGNSLQKLIGCLKGPRDTSFEGGIFYVNIELDDQYPFVPPKMRFITKVWHPNISSANGAICLDILKDHGNTSSHLLAPPPCPPLQALLSSPQPDDPQDAVVARQYMGSLADYQQTAKQWTETYAHAQVVGLEAKVQQIVEMGFAREQAVVALKAANGDENQAMELLLGA